MLQISTLRYFPIQRQRNFCVKTLPKQASLIAELEYGMERWNGTMEWKMEWNSERTQLQVTRVTGAAQSRLNYLVNLQACYLTAKAL